MFFARSQDWRFNRSFPAHRTAKRSIGGLLVAQQNSLGLIDSHAHIQDKEYTGEVDAVIGRAREAGVEQIVVVGGAGDMSSNTATVALTESWTNLYATVGMHPHHAKEGGEGALQARHKHQA